MRVMDKLERQFGRMVIPNLTYYLIAGQALLYVLRTTDPLKYFDRFSLSGNLVLQGQWWRIISFLFEPFGYQPIVVVLAWFIMYTFGSALEAIWGTFRYNAYVFLGYLAGIVLAFLFPGVRMTNGYLYTTIFLAYATLNPEHLMYLFFVLPVKVKWLAWFAWVSLAANFISADAAGKCILLGSLLNYATFFGRDIVDAVRSRRKQIPGKLGAALSPEETYLRCTECGATERDRKIFYYCKDCHPERCFCEDHIRRHRHIVKH